MAKRKYFKINPTEFFNISSDRTFIRPTSINLTLENRGEDFKLEYKETYQTKQPPKNQKWIIDTTISSLDQIQENIQKYNKYFYYQIKAIKKGYELMLISDDVFALFAAILAELMAFGVRDKEDAFNVIPFSEALLKWITKAKIVDE